MDKSRREDEGCPPLAIGQDSPGGSAQEHSTDHIHFSSEETQLQHCHQEQEQSSYYTQPEVDATIDFSQNKDLFL